MKHSYILSAIYSTPWAILPGWLATILEIAERHAAGEKLGREEVAARVGGATRPANRMAGQVQVLPLFGVITPRANLMSEVSGATSAERFGAQFRQAIQDPQVGAIVLDVDSPGGAVSGVDELAQEIIRSRGQKPVVAVANHLAASAAYWIATAADEVVVTPSGEVGSVGVFAAHEDASRALDQAGVTISLISAGKYKTESSPYGPLGEEARAAIQARVNEYYDMFVKAVALGRGVKAQDVRQGFGEGRVVGAREAVKLGMADRIATLDETIARLSRGRAPTGPTAEADLDLRRRRARLAGQS